PKVATYDLQPEMSAVEVTNKLVDAIESDKYDLIICNYANPDMVGHTGKTDAAEQAVSVMDECLKRVVSSLEKVGGEALITADHGNIETMFDETTGQPHTAHTNNLVPLIYVGRPASFTASKGSLDDVAPTVLKLLGLTPPKEMTGQTLITLGDNG
ncbi:MAG: alkaline phosphatase family protein, partial [Coxiellaceae bacterium]|nr:alkaline phosphatase family protein [Coxiellaceae bacterium]